MNKLYVPKLGFWAKTADILMIPVMYLVSGTFESPQRTHRWNNLKLSKADIRPLDKKLMVCCEGVKTARRFINPIFHMPICGGWRDYVVLHPLALNGRKWHVGWIAGDLIGVSRLELGGPVRLLLGPGSASFFGVDENGDQIALCEIGRGIIGDGGQFFRTPLL